MVLQGQQNGRNDLEKVIGSLSVFERMVRNPPNEEVIARTRSLKGHDAVLFLNWLESVSDTS
jgi:hypothetical protein